jgi:hypothetical protein
LTELKKNPRVYERASAQPKTFLHIQVPLLASEIHFPFAIFSYGRAVKLGMHDFLLNHLSSWKKNASQGGFVSERRYDSFGSSAYGESIISHRNKIKGISRQQQ